MKTILIADDNPAIRKTLGKLFEAEKGYAICGEAANGLEAINLAKACHPDLIILDLSMPVMDGLTAAKRLKEMLADVPIVLFTQYADVGASLLGNEKTFDRIVLKSEPKELMRLVKALVPV
jgi:CheY-like chemotaxis protein